MLQNFDSVKKNMNISYNQMNCDLDSGLQRTQKGEIFSCTIACTWAVTHLSGQGLHLSHSNNFIPQEKGYIFLVFQLFWINFFWRQNQELRLIEAPILWYCNALIIAVKKTDVLKTFPGTTLCGCVKVDCNWDSV